jgi:hypothetical protein
MDRLMKPGLAVCMASWSSVVLGGCGATSRDGHDFNEDVTISTSSGGTANTTQTASSSSGGGITTTSSTGSGGTSSSTTAGGSGGGGNGSGGSGRSGGSGGTTTDGTGGTGGTPTECRDDCPEGTECFIDVDPLRCFEICETTTPHVTLETAADVAALAALECEVITGDLTVSGTEITSLSGLDNLHIVLGQLVVGGSVLPNLDGLDGLLYINAGLNASANTDLVSISALSNVKFGEGSISFHGNDVLQSLDGLQGAKRIAGLALTSNPRLADITALSPERIIGNILFSASGAVPKVEFAELHTVEGSIQFTGEASLTAIAMPALSFISSNLLIAANPILAEIDLGALDRCPEITITGNAELRTLGGLPSLTSVSSSLTIAGNPKLPQCEVDEIDSRVNACNYCTENDPLATCE